MLKIAMIMADFSGNEERIGAPSVFIARKNECKVSLKLRAAMERGRRT
jgi:hypothetical protein